MRATKMFLFTFLAIAAGIWLAPAGLYAQIGTQATINGNVTDPSGAVIPGAHIVAVQNATHFTREADSDSAGNFQIPALPIGTYTVTVSANGMKTWEIQDLRLTIGAIQKVSPVLGVGAVNEVVTVQATRELQTETSSVQTTLDIPVLLDFPTASRDPIQFAQLTPGITYSAPSGPENGAYISGTGIRSNATSFTLDGTNINAPMDNGAIGVPIMDDIAEMTVEPSSASADAGRNPMQVKLVTKSGTNHLHGSVWEYFKNDALNAVYAFANKSQGKPKLRFNQFGGNLGGPILRNRAFYYGSFQATLNPSTNVYHVLAPSASTYQGNFPAGTKVKDPQTGLPFPNGPGGGPTIPANRINPASAYLAQFLPTANAGGYFDAQAPQQYKAYQSSLRLDYFLTPKQRIYARDIAFQSRNQTTAWLPSIVTLNNLDQNTIAVNYTYTITPRLLLTATAGFLQTANWFSSPEVGRTNYSDQAGIQGIDSAGRECCIGMPTLAITGYPGTSFPFGVNGKLYGNAPNTDLTVTLVRGKHTFSAGYALLNNRVYGQHASTYGRGYFLFSGTYTGNGLGDFLLGNAARSIKNLPLGQFGLDRNLLHSIHVDDVWKIRPDLTLNIGFRYEYFASPHFVAGNAATWDTAHNIIIAGEDSDGKVNLDHQPSAQAVAAATAGLWEPMSAAGIKQMIPSHGHWEPRLGFAWQPNPDMVIRGGYGVFENGIVGNRGASDIGAIPFFAIQQLDEGTTPVDYRYMWGQAPSFQQPSVNSTTSPHIDQARTQEWNLSTQTALPLSSSLTLSYIGNKAMGLPVAHDYNAPPPGKYANISKAQLHPNYGAIKLLENGADTWYHGLAVKWERRYTNGLYFLTSYMWSKSMSNHAYATGETSVITPYAPSWYERGSTPLDRRHNLKVTAIYNLPYGRGRMFGRHANWAMQEILGGWIASGYYAYLSGPPIAITVAGLTLGNGYGTRPDLVGNPNVAHPSKTQWFDPTAFATPAPYTFGNSGANPVWGPPLNYTDLGLHKDFSWAENRYVQIRLDAFNALNHVNLSTPGATIPSPSAGVISSAAAARTVQLGARIVF
ncbi:MAG: carboxypeptidase regulatory-like domain-containing protein [Acidobacteria bacterium]|nr:carboxypeptidase regulatory-like domain-containing protein [Acidobacteriota bacterium]